MKKIFVLIIFICIFIFLIFKDKINYIWKHESNLNYQVVETLNQEDINSKNVSYVQDEQEEYSFENTGNNKVGQKDSKNYKFNIKKIEGNYDHDEIQNKVDNICEKYDAVGVSTALVEDGKIIDNFCYGYSVKSSKKMSADTKFRIASISKVLVGISTMILQEKNIIDLDEDISNYWGFKLGTKANDTITIRSLLTHTSSLSDISSDISKTNYDGMVSALKSGSVIRNFKSGNIENYMYNNYGIDVLGMTLELASNKILDDVLNERIYNKLGIDSSFFGGELKDKSDVATIYQGSSIGQETSRIVSFKKSGPAKIGWAFAGGAVISCNDLAKIVAILSNGGIYNGDIYLSDTSIENLQYHEDEKVREYYQCQPLFYEENKFSQNKFYYHTGQAYGAFTLIGYNPDTKRGIVVLTSGAYSSKICDDIADLLLNISKDE